MYRRSQVSLISLDERRKSLRRFAYSHYTGSGAPGSPQAGGRKASRSRIFLEKDQLDLCTSRQSYSTLLALQIDHKQCTIDVRTANSDIQLQAAATT